MIKWISVDDENIFDGVKVPVELKFCDDEKDCDFVNINDSLKPVDFVNFSDSLKKVVLVNLFESENWKDLENLFDFCSEKVELFQGKSESWTSLV